MRTLFIALRAAVFATAFVYLWGWVALSVRALDRGLGMVLPAWTQELGILVMITGGSLVLTCIGIFVAWGQGTPAVLDPPRKFVAAGPYRYGRNPMYIGALILLGGFGLYQRSISILLFCLLWFLLVHLFVVYFEEPDLKSRFGTAYEQYCQAVPRWIPKR